jgi:hypothetical protein
VNREPTAWREPRLESLAFRRVEDLKHFTGDDAQARSILDRLTGACVPGSFLALSHAADIEAEQMAAVAKYLSQVAAQKPMLRDRTGVTRLFDGADLVEPGWSTRRSGGRTPPKRPPCRRRCGAAWPIRANRRQWLGPAEARPVQMGLPGLGLHL